MTCQHRNVGAFTCIDCGESTLRMDFERIRRTRACYRCGAPAGACRCAENDAEDESLRWAAEGEETTSRRRW